MRVTSAKYHALPGFWPLLVWRVDQNRHIPFFSGLRSEGYFGIIENQSRCRVSTLASHWGDDMSRSCEDSVLFAVVGMSPSVITETVWALAGAEPQDVPSRVVVLTTTAGREALRRLLFTADAYGRTGWSRLVGALERRGLDIEGKLKFGLAADHVRLFPSPAGDADLSDIATSGESAAAADFLLRELRAFTETPTTRVLASIAGGRKTMSALLMSCMSLLGREQDRVLHVLVNPPFDGPLDPPFLFPERGVTHRHGAVRLPSSRARVSLVDVPFVRMRGWYEGAFRSAPPGYAALVAGVQRQAPPPQAYPLLTFDCASGEVGVAGGQPVALSPSEFAALALLCRGESSHERLTARLKGLAARGTTPKTPDWVCRLQSRNRFSKDADCDELRKTLSSARKKIEAHPLLADVAESLVPKRGKPQRYPPGKVRFVGPDVFADVRG